MEFGLETIVAGLLGVIAGGLGNWAASFFAGRKLINEKYYLQKARFKSSVERGRVLGQDIKNAQLLKELYSVKKEIEDTGVKMDDELGGVFHRGIGYEEN